MIPLPHCEVSRLEDTFQRNLSSLQPLASDQLKSNTGLPHRPGYGTRGREIILWANHFEMDPDPDLILHRYNIVVRQIALESMPSEKTAPAEQNIPTGPNKSTKKDMPSRKKLSQVIRLLLDAPVLANLKDDIVADFKTTLLSHEKLDSDALEHRIQYRAENEPVPRANAARYQIFLEYQKPLAVNDLVKFRKSEDSNSSCGDKSD